MPLAAKMNALQSEVCCNKQFVPARDEKHGAVVADASAGFLAATGGRASNALDELEFFRRHFGSNARTCFKNRANRRSACPQRLKPGFCSAQNGTAEAMPFQGPVFETRCNVTSELPAQYTLFGASLCRITRSA